MRQSISSCDFVPNEEWPKLYRNRNRAYPLDCQTVITYTARAPGPILPQKNTSRLMPARYILRGIERKGASVPTALQNGKTAYLMICRFVLSTEAFCLKRLLRM